MLIIQLSVVLAQDQTVKFDDFAGGANIPMGILLPGARRDVGDQRVEPAHGDGDVHPRALARRGVLAAKFVGTLIIALAAVVVGCRVDHRRERPLRGVRGNPVNWDLGAVRIFCFFLLYVFAMATGFAFGMLLLNTAAAIVVYFVYSFIFPASSSSARRCWTGSRTCSPWIDFAQRPEPLIEADVTGKEWAQLAVSGFIWLVLPLVIGVWRVLRAEVK